MATLSETYGTEAMKKQVFLKRVERIWKMLKAAHTLGHIYVSHNFHNKQ
jgi:hypothetical protein